MISGVITALLLLLFIAACVWVWRPARKTEFDAAARMALEDSDAGAGK
jgi:cytochrome c oxidase cbb3-type subunit 4